MHEFECLNSSEKEKKMVKSLSQVNNIIDKKEVKGIDETRRMYALSH